MPVTRKTGKLPEFIDPMLAKLGTMPLRQAEYFFEFKWDGIRAICFLDDKGPRFQSRNLKDFTAAFPEVVGACKSPGLQQTILDGEIVAFDEEGKPSFSLLQQRMHVADAREAAIRSKSIPATYMVFDILYWQGKPLFDLPLHKRRELLDEITLPRKHWKLSTAYEGEGDALQQAAEAAQLEGIIAKKSNSVYRPGYRSNEWIKIKIVQSDEFVIGGWTDESTGRSNMLGGLLLGYFEGDAGRLRYVGKVGTGFTEKSKAELTKRLQKIETKLNLFDSRLPRGKYHFAKPELVGEIEFRGWTPDGKLRQPSFKGLRTDKAPAQIVKPESLYGRQQV